MSDNQDLKSKILLMRQKNFGELVNESNEKNDNEKPENAEINKDKVLTKSNEDEVSVNKNNLENKIQVDINLEMAELKEHLSKIAKTNEEAFDLLGTPADKKQLLPLANVSGHCMASQYYSSENELQVVFDATANFLNKTLLLTPAENLRSEEVLPELLEQE